MKKFNWNFNNFFVAFIFKSSINQSANVNLIVDFKTRKFYKYIIKVLYSRNFVEMIGQ